MNKKSAFLTPSGTTSIENLSVGDKLLVPLFLELGQSPAEEDPSLFSRNWHSEELSFLKWVETTVIEKSFYSSRLYFFNKNSEDSFPRQQKIFIRRDGRYLLVDACQVIVSDELFLLQEDKTFKNILVSSVDSLDPQGFYSVWTEPYGWFVCDNHMLYSKSEDWLKRMGLL